MAEHNHRFIAVVLVGVVLAVDQLVFNEDLALGYGIIALGLLTVAGFFWSKRKRPDA